MTKRYSEYDEKHKEFYFYLGLISTRFAVVEFKILKMLGLLISDDFVLTNTLFERNSLAQNIEYLKKINKLKRIEEKATQNLIQQITNVKGKRNLFVHGLWGEPKMKENDLIISCADPKMDYSEEFENGKRISRMWKSVTSNEFRLSYLKKLSVNLSDIIFAQNHLIKKFEEFNIENT